MQTKADELEKLSDLLPADQEPRSNLSQLVIEILQAFKQKLHPVVPTKFGACCFPVKDEDWINFIILHAIFVMTTLLSTIFIISINAMCNRFSSNILLLG